MVDEVEEPRHGGDGDFAERLKSAVARIRGWALTRPELVVRRAPNLSWLTHGVMGAAAAALVIVLVGGLVLTSTPGSAGRSGGPNSPVAAATPTPTPMDVWTRTMEPTFAVQPYQSLDPNSQNPGSTTGDGALPTLGPLIALPTLNLDAVATAKVLASVPCRLTQMLPVPVAAGRAYFACDTDVIAVDLATNRVVSRYPGVNRTNACGMACDVWPDVILLDNAGGFWASAQIPATLKNVTRRYDIATGTVTKEEDGWLMGGGDGVMYLYPSNGADFIDGPVVGRSIRTGNVVTFEKVGETFQRLNVDPGMGLASGSVGVVCGSLLATERLAGNTVLDYQGWAANQQEPGLLWATMEYGGVCWGLFNDNGGDYSRYGPFHVTRFGPSGMDQRSPELPVPVKMWNGKIWLDLTPLSATARVYQRLDQTTWQPVGAPWRLPTSCYWPTDVAGVLWCGSPDTVSRMDVPMNGVTRVLPTPSITASPAPTASASPWAAPSASPSAMPFPSAEASM
jgi:hypothetical protein